MVAVQQRATPHAPRPLPTFRFGGCLKKTHGFPGAVAHGGNTHGVQGTPADIAIYLAKGDVFPDQLAQRRVVEQRQRAADTDTVIKHGQQDAQTGAADFEPAVTVDIRWCQTLPETLQIGYGLVEGALVRRQHRRVDGAGGSAADDGKRVGVTGREYFRQALERTHLIGSACTAAGPERMRKNRDRFILNTNQQPCQYR